MFERVRALPTAAKVGIAALVGLALLAGVFGSTGRLLLGAAVLGFLYLIPTIVAYRRRHYQLTAIAVINVFAGWTLIGWVGALAWAVTKPPGSPHSSGPH